jgi:hypothetical protein
MGRSSRLRGLNLQIRATVPFDEIVRRMEYGKINLLRRQG